MQKRQFMIKKVLPIQLILIMVLMLVLPMFGRTSKAYTQTKVSGIEAFPDSYKAALRELKNKHSNWNFTAYNTGMTWQQFIGGETSKCLRNTVHVSSESSWKHSCNKVNSNYACASNGIISYYADPRNFLTEEGIFQFMEMSYNSSVQSKQGVENILKGTFMDASVTITGERHDSSIKVKQKDAYILISPKTKNSEVAQAVGMNNFRVKDRNNKNVSNDAYAGTGYTFTNTTYNTSYTMVVMGDVMGDGEIKASDYMKIKNYIMEKTTLSNIQKMAADANGDGEIKASDYMKIKNYIMEKTNIGLAGTTTSKENMRYADIIMKAAEESGISPYSIAIKIIQEVGRQGSGSVSGKYRGYEGYYNFFNWGAYDGGNAIENGLMYAKAQGWNNQYTSIVEGAKKLANSYVSVGQNTAYFYKFDVIDDGSNGVFSHQYMTNIKDPTSQAANLYNTYTQNNILDISLNFVIPVYDGMPSACYKPSIINTNNSTSYYINGTYVRLRSKSTTDSDAVAILDIGEVVTLVQSNVSNANGYTWSKIRRANGTEGYVANTYITKC